MAKFEALGPGPGRAGFDCGEPALNGYLQKTARQHSEKNVSRTFVLLDEHAPESINGFFTLTMCEVEAPSVPAVVAKKLKLPSGRLPGVKLVRMAVRVDEQGKGYGSVVLFEAIQQVAAAGRDIGRVGLFVDAKGERARAFYEHFGFLPLQDRTLEPFLPFASVLEASEPEMAP